MVDIFLSAQELAVLTGRKMKSKQIDALRRMGVAFFVNACGRPVVARSVIEGGRPGKVNSGWAPDVMRA
ncbi:hypothetical protein AX768_13740 [Burkholderia sp. PAMC 28687]|uniref:DUF4224 domain-containing protein n=1 Tax=Burkholderia sp. PAMC 28687 TaxID=1795874 RepID=UPI00078216BF|nr:DUF4224 domain-containing protein [Burkholderia sp. PAMC 28687]AMM15000.1 hypothetical protein AX768_13740 [Burkholderia sp. PAMC 28687]